MGTTSKILTLLSAPAFPNLLYRRSSSHFLHLSRHATLSSATSRRISHSSPRRIPPLRSSSRLHSQSSFSNFDVSGTGNFSRGGSPFVSEILKLVEGLSNGKEGSFENYRESSLRIEEDELLVNKEEAGSDFLKAVDVCMKIARDRPDALRFLSRKDLEVIVYNGSPSLFKNGTISTSRMKLFLNGDESKILESERAQTVDIMRYVLSYAYNSLIISEQPSQNDAKIIDTSFRNIIFQLVNMSGTGALPRQTPVSYEQASRPPMTEVEMKPGDWICGKCSFMNFAKNSRCLECDETRPKSRFSLSNGEWECPQCDYYNYRRNMSCLRCDCKRPGESPITPCTKTTTLDQILSGKKPDDYNLEQRLAANDEKAEKWFNKMSQMGDNTDLDDSTPDEDFPELIPLRKGSNNFVVSTRKTPLERRLANSQSETSKSSESSISKSLDRILGRNKSASQSESADYRQSIAKSDPNYVPFVPLSPDLFKEPQNSAKEGFKNDNSISTSDNNATAHNDDFPEIMPMRKGENRFVVSKKKDRSLISPPYKKRMAMEQANQSDFIPFVPFPPDYFAKKDKQPESTSNKTATIASENAQAISTNSDNSSNNASNNIGSYGFTEGKANYHNTHPNIQNNTNNSWSDENDNKSYVSTDTSSTYGSTQEVQKYSSPGFSQGAGKYQNAPQDTSWNSSKSNMSYTSKSISASYDTNERAGKYQNIPQDNSWNSSNPNESYTSRNTSSSYDTNEGVGKYQNTPHDKSWNSSKYMSKNTSSTYDSNQGVGKYQSASQSTQDAKSSYSFTGKSLEGSAVADDPDPLDMSEEAKAARWFRRAAQIKNISELSEIPDEDFPEIMPMRKGVNRFVVSKRKTPLERRLTSPQYRRNLPIVSSEPEKDSN